jgi:hypothetical protein
MPKDTVTIALNGEVTIQRFSNAIIYLVDLIQVLSKEMNPKSPIKWVVQSLEVSSAIATARGDGILDEVEQIVNAYIDVGETLESGRRPKSEKVANVADGYTNLFDEGITSIRFETADRDAVLTRNIPSITPERLIKSYGAIEGQIQTLTNRKGLRFTLYDALHDKAVSCYLNEGREEMIREAWGKRAFIQGEITREAISKRPVSVRNITLIKIISEVTASSYLKARGIIPIQQGTDMMPEIIIRQGRDAV